MLLIQTWGYLGVFVAGFLSTFSLFLPSPTFVAVLVLGSALNPFLLGVIGGLGATVGEMVGYIIGYGAGYGAEHFKKIKKSLQKVEKCFKKHSPGVVIFIFAALPLIPFDVVGLFCGAIKYDKKKFFVLTLGGKIIKYLVLAYAGFYGANWILELFG
jgi:membrane protein YqaA with SNARE-associated domain